MSIANYTELKAAIAQWVNKTNLTTQIPDFIRIAEAKLNRRLRVSSMETALAETTIAAGVVARPADMLAIKAIWSTGADQVSLKQTNLEFINSQPTNVGPARWFAWNEAGLSFYPTGGAVAATYYAKIPALTDSAVTNWLLADSPDLYLWASIEQAHVYLHNVEGEALFRARTDALIDELNGRSVANQLSGGPLVAHARR